MPERYTKDILLTGPSTTGLKTLLAAITLLLTLGPTFTPEAALAQEGEEVIKEKVQRTLHHEIQVKVDPQTRTVKGTDTITLKRGVGPEFSTPLKLLLRKGSFIGGIETLTASTEGDGGVTALPYTISNIPEREFQEVTVTLPKGDGGGAAPGDTKIRVAFHGTFMAPAEAISMVRRGVAHVSDGVIGKEGVFLPGNSGWYPFEEEALTTYFSTVYLPDGPGDGKAGYSHITEGERSGQKSFNIPFPIDGLNLVAGRYHIERERYKGIEISTYLYEDDPALSKTYIDKTKHYIDLYSKILPPYPFKNFSIVENFLPTGYGMPTFTLLGSQVIRLPFIPDTSLGHEFSHSWWGNSVYMDPLQGNWAEALSTYTADHLYKENHSPAGGRKYRLKSLVAYTNFKGEDPIPLRDFYAPVEASARAVGYNKGMFLFHTLRRTVGDDLFYKSLRRFYLDNRFKRAGWKEIMEAFEGVSRRPLKYLFREWLIRTGNPELELSDVGMEIQQRMGRDLYKISFRIVQRGDVYRLPIQLLIDTTEGPLVEEFDISRRDEIFNLVIDTIPKSIEIDPEYHLLRELRAEEMPPTLGAILGGRGSSGGRSLIMIEGNAGGGNTGDDTGGLGEIGEHLKGEFEIEGTASFKEKRNILYIGTREGLPGEIAGVFLDNNILIGEKAVIMDGAAYRTANHIVLVTTRDKATGKTVGVLTGSLMPEAGPPVGEPDESSVEDRARQMVKRIMMRLPHYTSKSYVVFKSDGSAKSGIFFTENNLKYTFR